MSLVKNSPFPRAGFRRRLTLEQQQVITLALEGMSYQEIADVLAITVNLVGVRLQRAKTALMQLLEAV